MINELSERIWNRHQFQEDYINLLSCAMKKSLRISDELPTVSEEVLSRLIKSASTFAGTSDWLYRESAYRIGIASWVLFGDKIINILEIIDFILKRMGNFPTSNLLRSYTSESKEKIPLGLWFETALHKDANTVLVHDSDEITLTDFQRAMWQHLQEGQSITITAPTSSGKSFALQNFLVAQSLKKDTYTAVYLVPTRALINQVSNSLTKLIMEYNEQDNIFVSTIPAPISELGKRVIYVLTQERLQLLNSSQPDYHFNLMVADESQMLSDDSRGIVLQTVIEKIINNSPETQIMFASPLTENPEVFSKLFKLENVAIIDEDECPVSQNLIFLDVLNSNEVTIDTTINERLVHLAKKRLNINIYDEEHPMIANISWEFGKFDKNLVYAGGQAACEKIASMIFQLATEDSIEIQQDTLSVLKNFSKFIKDHIHPKYILATTLEYGIAFHYGNMPAIVRKTIEELFSEGNIQFLVCTSTLLHGVNLPAKNLFLLNPTKGREWGSSEDIPISSVEFWNLAGRAGRLGKDFEGNVFIINRGKWRNDPLQGNKKQTVRPSIIRNLEEKSDELLTFINDNNHPSGQTKNQGFENAFVKLFNDYTKGNIDKTFDYLTNEGELHYQKEIINVLEQVKQIITVPQSLLEKNITISPYRQQAMLDYLFKKIEKEGPERFIPLHPSMDWKKTHESMWRMFKRIHTNFERLPGKNKSHFYFAPLALRWMRGDSLRRLIDDAYEYRKKQSKREPSIATIIRNVMQNIEQDLRFRYVKYTSCYIDLLKHVLIETGNEDYIESIPTIPLFLELGACSKTMVSFIGVGLSRTTAGILASKTVNKDMGSKEALSWIMKQNLEGIGVPVICIKEINKIVFI